MWHPFRTPHEAPAGKQRSVLVVVALCLVLTVLTAPAFAQGARAIADFNGDGVEDLAVGAPNADGYRGTVSIFLGVRGVGFARDTPNLTLSGSEQSETYGYALAAADFDGDGRSELVVGAPAWNQGYGRVEVVQFFSWTFGSLVPSSRSLSKGSFGGSASPNDRFGSSLATGDFDDDNYPDLAIGVPYDGLGVKAGSVIVFRGGRTGLSIKRFVWWLAQWFDGTAAAGDQMGRALAAGDFNGDGVSDLAVGVPFKDLSFSNQGAVVVIHGVRDEGLGANGYLTFTTDNPRAGNDLFGYALAAGDFDRDGISDLAVGAPYGDPFGPEVTGYMAIKYGPIHPRNPMRVEPREPGLIQPNARFGAALAAGDFTGDGHDDIAVGAPAQDVGVSDAGTVVVYYGGTRFYLDPAHVFHQDSFHVRDRCEQSDAFGASLTTGDFNGDGLADLAIGVPGEDLGTTTTLANAGAVAVLTGTPTVLSPDPNFLLIAARRQAGAAFGAAVK
jgi:hypothetical protein